jgi:hypothetical protein
LIIEFEGRSWQYDEDAVTVQQAIALHLTHGLTIKAWQAGISELDPRALQFCYWLMLSQNDVKPGLLKDLDFAVVEFINAYSEGQAPAAEEEPEPDPTQPSPPEDPPSPEPSTPTATTPTPHARRPATTGF